MGSTLQLPICKIDLDSYVNNLSTYTRYLVHLFKQIKGIVFSEARCTHIHVYFLIGTQAHGISMQINTYLLNHLHFRKKSFNISRSDKKLEDVAKYRNEDIEDNS
jgi:hypothetical protein